MSKKSLIIMKRFSAPVAAPASEVKKVIKKRPGNVAKLSAMKVRPAPVRVKVKPPKAGPATPKNLLPPEIVRVIENNTQMLEVYVEGGKPERDGHWEYPVLATSATAEVFDVSALTISKWIKEGMIPSPKFKRVDSRIGNYYHQLEVQAMAELLLEHRKTFKYYRQDHADLTQRLSHAVGQVRRGLIKA